MSVPLKYYCINCGFVWGNLDAGEDNISHGICRRCLRDLQKDTIRRKQSYEGVSPCYAQGHEDCTERQCTFWCNCLETNIKEWERYVCKESQREKNTHNG